MDRVILARMRDALRQKNPRDLNSFVDLRVCRESSQVVLSGFLPSWRLKQDAQEALAKLADESSLGIQNDIAVA